MGCFSSKKPQMNVPPPPKLPTAEELYNAALGYAKTEYPLAFGSREGALADIGKGTSFYEGFQPTSIEQALGNQYFQNVVPDLERSIKHSLSLSGMAYSPILAEQIAKARGQVGFDVGSYLANQGNERARYSIESRLGIDPNSMVTPHVQTGANQANMQADYNYQSALMQAQADYSNAMEKYKQSQSMKTALMIGGGALLGGAFLPGLLGMAPAMTGASGALLTASGAPAMSGLTGSFLGSSIAGGLSPLIGGGASPMNFGDAISVYQNSRNPQSVYNNTSNSLSIQDLLNLSKLMGRG